MKFLPFVVLAFSSFSSSVAVEEDKGRNLRRNHRRNALAVEHNIAQSRIVGGTTAQIDEFPFFVNWGGCGASLIGKEWVLTAAHCDVISYTWLKVNQSRELGSAGRGVTKYIDKRIPHPQYESRTVRNDFMLMKLTSALTDAAIPPIDLNSNNNVPSNNQDLKVIGFGRLEDGGRSADDLQEVTVQYITTNECNDSDSYDGDVDKTMMCAGVDGGGKDSCQGDSGGPLFMETNGKFTQVGIVSWGVGCAEENYPGVYARISDAFDWIKDTVCNDSSTQYPPEFCNGNGGGGGSTPAPPTRPPTRLPTNPPTSPPTRPPTSPPTTGSNPTSPTPPTNNNNGIGGTGSSMTGTGSVQVRLVMTYDEYPDENSWEFLQDDEVVASGSGNNALAESTVTYEYNINPGSTTFRIFDTQNDGICCSFGLGSYEIYEDDSKLTDSNGEFSGEEITRFTIIGSNNNPPPPTPSPVSSTNSCGDAPNTQFLVDSDVGNQDCDWLQTNMGNFGYLCKFLDVAWKCKKTCDVCRYFE